MHTEVFFALPLLHSFLLALARVSGFLVCVPFPGLNGLPEAARIVLALALTMCLMPAWPAPSDAALGNALAMVQVAGEFVFGLAVGVVVACLLEGLLMATQILGLQAGFSYAFMIDPNTQADSGVLQLAAYLIASSLFFSLGLDRFVLTAMAHTVRSDPAILNADSAGEMIRLAGGIFTTGVRLSMPVVAFLMLLDISLAVLGKINAQLQLLSVTFSVKMLAGLALLAAALPAFPPILRAGAERSFQIVARLLE